MKHLFIIYLIMPFALLGQDIQYAREVISILSSGEFKGRGYVEGGDQLAADYITNQFSEIGLKSFKKTFLQPFNTPVNSFPGKMVLQLGNELKEPGVEFLIDPGSPGIAGQYETIWLSAEEINEGKVLGNKLRSSSGKFIVIPPYDKKKFNKDQNKLVSDLTQFLRYHPESPSAGVIVLTHDKLTWGGSTMEYEKPSFTVKVDSSYSVFETVSFQVENEFYKKYKSQNVVGYVEGVNSDSMLVFTAHYDHLGMMGKEALFPGANDNASGVAILLNLAKYYTQNKPKYDIAFIAFGGEEIGLVGAKFFVDNPLFSLNKIKFLINFDISGTGDEGIQVVNGKTYRDKYDELVQINEENNYLKQVKIRGEACNSDHCMFHMNKVPCFFIYTLGGIQAYHDVYDKSETLPLTEYEDYFRLITKFVGKL